MKWNNAEIYTSFFMVELENGVRFYDSPLGLYGAFTSLESPFFADPEIKSYLESFLDIRYNFGMEVDVKGPVLKELPGIFISAAGSVDQAKALEVLNQHLEVPYTPVTPDFRVLGFFPSRPGSPIREIAKDGVVYQNGKEYAKEFTSEAPPWAEELVAKAAQHCDAKYNHYKITENPFSEKAYIHATKLY